MSRTSSGLHLRGLPRMDGLSEQDLFVVTASDTQQKEANPKFLAGLILQKRTCLAGLHPGLAGFCLSGLLFHVHVTDVHLENTIAICTRKNVMSILIQVQPGNSEG